MKKYFMILVLTILTFVGINKVNAADDFSSFKSIIREKAVNVIEQYHSDVSISVYNTNLEGFEYDSELYTLNGGLTIDLEVDGKSYTTQYVSYHTKVGDKVVIEYYKVGNPYYDVIFNFYLLDFYVRDKSEGKASYDPYRFNQWLYKLKNSGEYNSLPITIQNYGIEFSIDDYLSEDEYINLWGFNLSNEYKLDFYRAIYNTLKIKFDAALNYDEENISIFHFNEGSINQKFNLSRDKNLTFTIDADSSLLNAVYVDGELVDNSNYTVKSGSTIITFNDNFIKSLSSGDHTLKVTYNVNDYEEFATTNFTLYEALINPGTGINMSYGIFILIGLAGLAGYLLFRKRSKFPNHS